MSDEAGLVLLSSPLLGPSVWASVAHVFAGHGRRVTIGRLPPAPLTAVDVASAFAATLPVGQDVVVVAHSNAGAYAPGLSTHASVIATVFVDAILPPTSGDVALAPGPALPGLREMADPDGRLPVWTAWWDDADVTALLPDAEVRARVESEQQRVPIDYLESTVPVPGGWTERPAAYLAFGSTYERERLTAERRGWPVRTLPGGHLHMLADPAAVADAILVLLDRLGVSGVG